MMGINTEFITYPSTNGSNTLSATLFMPDNKEIVAVVQVSHGMCENIGRYSALAEFLCTQGIAMCGNDHLGHRHSVQSEEELGFFAEQDGYKLLIQDVHSLTTLIQERLPNVPCFLLGHSMGSFIARCVLAKFGTEYAGAVLSGTGGPNPMAGMGIAAANTVCKLQGSKKRSKMLNRLAFGSYNSHFEKRTPKDWLTRDNAIIDAYLADPYCTFLFTASAFRDLFTLVSLSNNPHWAQHLPKDLPIYIFSGEQDPVGDYGAGVRKVYDMIKGAGLFDVTLKLYKDGRHEMLNEINRAEVYTALYEWLKRKI